MLKTGAEHLESLRDGRRIYIGNELVRDVTTHPAFKNGAHTMASIYDMKRAPETRDQLAFQENGQWYSNYYLRARSKEDLQRRTNVHKAIARHTYGMFGRSPDHVSSFVTGMTMNPSVFGAYEGNLHRYYEELRERDLYAVYAVLPPQASRDPKLYAQTGRTSPTLRVVREEDDGVVISGMKMLATGGAFANEIWVGNLLPLNPDQGAESITCSVPVNAKGLSLWSRKPLETNVTNDFEGPLTFRYDESDAMLICDEVKVPWERVFVHNDAALSRQIYMTTAGHSYGNHQSNVRYLSKLQLLVGAASRVTQATGANQVPVVRETMGRLASLEALLSGMIDGQIHAAEDFPAPGFKCFNRRYVYSALNWCTESYSEIVDTVRQLCGGGVFQMPGDISVMKDPQLGAYFEKYWDTVQLPAVERMKLFKLAWDLVGSEFAGRHQQYEKFYAGASFIVRGHNFNHADWTQLHGVVDGLLNSYGLPDDAMVADQARPEPLAA